MKGARFPFYEHYRSPSGEWDEKDLTSGEFAKWNRRKVEKPERHSGTVVFQHDIQGVFFKSVQWFIIDHDLKFSAEDSLYRVKLISLVSLVRVTIDSNLHTILYR